MKAIELSLTNCSLSQAILKDAFKGFSRKMRIVKVILKIDFSHNFLVIPIMNPLSWFMIPRVSLHILSNIDNVANFLANYLQLPT